MNSELIESLDLLAKEKGIDRESIFEAIENALVAGCRNLYGRNENIKNIRAEINRDTGDYRIYAEKTVVETADDVMDPLEDISPEDARAIAPDAQVGDVVQVDIKSDDLTRIAAMSAKNVILQKIREEERHAVFDQFSGRRKNVVTGTFNHYVGGNASLNLGKADGILAESEMIPGEKYSNGDRLKVYVLDVKSTPKGPRISVSRTHPELVRCLFENEVTEIADGIVEIRSIAREPGSRSKIAVWSNNPDVDPVGACVGMNGDRVNAVVSELNDEKIDIVCWDDNPGNLVQNALSPASVLAVFADPYEKTAKVVVPDDQLSLAIGKEGQNARLAARLTGYKIDIKSESQAKDAPGFRYEDYEYSDEADEAYDENYEEGYSEAPSEEEQ
ncbi:MAG: transcription termination/antitermination protein NusA [Lachnospiraceae bacterium]|nr:transcription termination/antitermination protein NusA [Lachnospiraceae bacterium]